MLNSQCDEIFASTLYGTFSTNFEASASGFLSYFNISEIIMTQSLSLKILVSKVLRNSIRRLHILIQQSSMGMRVLTPDGDQGLLDLGISFLN